MCWMNGSLSKYNHWIKVSRHVQIKELIARLNQKLRGHYGYYGITFNSRGLRSYYEQTKRKLYKWLNRRGGKGQIWNWEKITKLTEEWIPLKKKKIYHSYL